MAIANLRTSFAPIPKPDFSWLDGLAQSGGALIEKAGNDKRLARLADEIGPTAAGQSPVQPQSWLSKLVGGNQQQPAAATPMTAAVGPVDRGPAQGSTFQPFIDTIRTKVTNPYGLAAVAATGRAESGWSPQNAARSWSDPSQSGQAGTAGGVMSWRAERLQNLQNYARSKGEDGNGSPATQAEFFLNEDPNLIARLNSAKSPQEAQAMMNGAWKFAGFDKPGGETARRMAMAQNYYAQDFRDAAGAPQGQPTPQGVPPTAAMPSPVNHNNTQGGGVQVASLDPSAGIPMPGWAGAMRANDPARTLDAAQPAPVQPSIAAVGGDTPISATQIGNPSAPPLQTAQQGGGRIIAPGATPIQRGGVEVNLIQRLLRDPQLNQLGLELWKANVKGQNASDTWQFVQLDDGTLARANKQTGEVMNIGNFAKPAGKGGGEYGLNVIYGKDENGNTVIGQVGKDGTFHQVDTSDFKPVGGTTQQNLGTSYVTRDKAGNVIDSSAIDKSGEAQQTATGKNIAEAQAALPQVESSANQMLATIDSLSSDPYLGNMLGPWDSRTPEVTANAARVRSKMDQIGGQSFLQAFNMLRGGGQITEIEGAKATAAMARLNTAQSENDYKAALADLRDIVVGSVSRARQKAGRAASVAPQGGTGADIQAARDAIARGAPREAVIKRLQDAGIDTEGL